jgi:hypothetical protein
MGLNMKEKQAVAREYRPRYEKATNKEKRALLEEQALMAAIYKENAGLSQEYKDMLKVQSALYNSLELQQNVNKTILRLRQRLAAIPLARSIPPLLCTKEL